MSKTFIFMLFLLQGCSIRTKSPESSSPKPDYQQQLLNKNYIKQEECSKDNNECLSLIHFKDQTIAEIHRNDSKLIGQWSTQAQKLFIELNQLQMENAEPQNLKEPIKIIFSISKDSRKLKASDSAIYILSEN